MIPDEFFGDQALSRALFASIHREVDAIGEAGLRVTKSQIAFSRHRTFAAVWMPGQYLKNRQVAPLVLTVFLPYRDESPRWKEIVESAPGRLTHHLELYDAADIDQDVRRWLQQAWDAAI